MRGYLSRSRAAKIAASFCDERLDWLVWQGARLSLNEAEMLFDAGKAAVHRAHDAEQAIERLRVLAQRGRVLVLDHLPLPPNHA